MSTEGVKSQRGGNKHDKIRNWEYMHRFFLRKRGLRGVLLWGEIISSLKSSYRLKVGASIFLEEDETETTFLGRGRVRLGPILFTTHKIERRKGTTALNSEIKHWPALCVKTSIKSMERLHDTRSALLLLALYDSCNLEMRICSSLNTFLDLDNQKLDFANNGWFILP